MKKADDDEDNYENRRPPETLKLLLSLSLHLPDSFSVTKIILIFKFARKASFHKAFVFSSDSADGSTITASGIRM